jgi:hypothetical protein
LLAESNGQSTYRVGESAATEQAEALSGTFDFEE